MSRIKTIYIIILLSLMARVISAYYYSDYNLTDEWAMIFHNFKISGILGINVVMNDYIAIQKFAEIGEKVLPSVFMPPLYFYLIYIISLISNDLFSTANLIIFFQILLSLISIIVFYKLVSIKKKNEKYSIVLTLILSFFPIYVYASSKISSITLQIFLTIVYLFFLFKFQQKKKLKYLILFSFFSGLLILARGEFILFYFLSIFYFFLFYKRDFKSILLSLIITTLVVSPYLYRNYKNFKTITITKSFGYNLLKGNNPTLKVEGNDEFVIDNYVRKKNLKIETKNDYEIKLDDLYKNEAITYIKKEPLKYLKFYFKKVFSFTFIDFDSSYPNYYNILHLAPKIVLSIISLIGALIVISKKGLYQFLSIFYFTNIFLFSIFFILPRYSLILLPFQLLLAIEAIKYLRRKLINNFSNNLFR